MDITPTHNTVPLQNGNFGSLAEALDYAATGRTGYNFYDGRGRLATVLSYLQLQSEARNLAAKLLAVGAERGSRVAIIADTHPDFMKIFFACQYAGLVPVPLPATMFLGGREAYVGQIHRLLRDCQADIAMAPVGFLPFLLEAAKGLELLFVGRIDDLDGINAGQVKINPSQRCETAYIQYTSGSTRYPRGVVITQKAVMHNLSSIIRTGIKVQEDDRCMSWLPFYHDMGLVGMVLAPMASQMSVDYLNTRDFAMRPRLWLNLISRNQSTISFGPPFGYELCVRRIREPEGGKFKLDCWRIAGIGAEIIRPEPLQQFARILKSSGFDARAFMPCYGMAECSLAVSFMPLGRGLWVDRVRGGDFTDQNRAFLPVDADDVEKGEQTNRFVVCGIPLPGYEVEIRDECGNVLPERHCGFLFVRGDSVMEGYFGKEDETREVLSADGWLNTGDMAYLLDGNLVITGRQKDLIIINGRNIWPQDLEFIAEQQPEVRTGDASAFSINGHAGAEKAVLVVQCRGLDVNAYSELAHRLHGLVKREMGIDCMVELVPRNTLPRTTSGKLSRSGARSGFMDRHAGSKASLSETLYSFPEISAQAI